MNPVLKFIGNEQFIINEEGSTEFIVIPVKQYQKLVELLEDYGLGLAIKEAEEEKIYHREDALQFLENDKH